MFRITYVSTDRRTIHAVTDDNDFFASMPGPVVNQITFALVKEVVQMDGVILSLVYEKRIKEMTAIEPASFFLERSFADSIIQQDDQI